jgi:hypothetical protein
MVQLGAVDHLLELVEVVLIEERMLPEGFGEEGEEDESDEFTLIPGGGVVAFVVMVYLLQFGAGIPL